MTTQSGNTARRPSGGRLSPRRLQVATLVAEGKQSKEIAEILGLSPGTIKQYLHDIYRHLGIANRAELASWETNRQRDYDPPK